MRYKFRNVGIIRIPPLYQFITIFVYIKIEWLGIWSEFRSLQICIFIAQRYHLGIQVFRKVLLIFYSPQSTSGHGCRGAETRQEARVNQWTRDERAWTMRTILAGAFQGVLHLAQSSGLHLDFLAGKEDLMRQWGCAHWWGSLLHDATRVSTTLENWS